MACGLLFRKAAGQWERRTKGRVIEVRQSVGTQNQGSATEIKVRTRQQQELWLHLGPSDGTGDGFQVGDTIRARLCKRISDNF